MMQSLEDIEASMREQQAASGGPQFKSLEEIEASLVGDGESVCHRLRGHRPHQPTPPVLALALAHPLADRSTKHCVCLSLCPATFLPNPTRQIYQIRKDDKTSSSRHSRLLRCRLHSNSR